MVEGAGLGGNDGGGGGMGGAEELLLLGGEGGLAASFLHHSDVLASQHSLYSGENGHLSWLICCNCRIYIKYSLTDGSC